MVETKVRAGICGFKTEIKASSEDDQHVRFGVVSDCEKIQALAARLSFPVDAFHEIQTGFEGELFKATRQTLQGCCAGCVVPAGLFKSMQVAAKLNLPRDVKISFGDLASD